MRRRFSQLAAQLPHRHLAGPSDPEVGSVTADSRRVGSGDVYVAVRGNAADGHRFVPAAVEAGAGAVVVDRAYEATSSSTSFFSVEDSRHALAHLAREAWGRPDQQLLLCAITGTNGKTTVAHLTRDLFAAWGRPCGMLGTIRYETGARSIEASLTTPAPEDFFTYLREMVDASLVSCALEASSHALDQERMGEAEVDIAAFTNLTREHLEYHSDFAAYAAAKRLLLKRVGSEDRKKPAGRAVVNVDDAQFAAMDWPQGTVTVGSGDGCSVRRLDQRCDRHGIELHLDYDGREVQLRSSLLGRYNVENLTVLAGIALAAGMGADELVEYFPRLKPIPGRLEAVELDGGPLALVDYAHTPDGLANALEAARELSSGRVIIVFGCGGDRDRGKRPLMAEAALAGADFVFLTIDNPRSEDPEQIFRDTEVGFADDPSRALRVEDRQRAISAALQKADEQDLVLVAGKGHENYQLIGDEKRTWDDRQALRRAWRERGGAA